MTSPYLCPCPKWCLWIAYPGQSSLNSKIIQSSFHIEVFYVSVAWRLAEPLCDRLQRVGPRWMPTTDRNDIITAYPARIDSEGCVRVRPHSESMLHPHLLVTLYGLPYVLRGGRQTYGELDPNGIFRGIDDRKVADGRFGSRVRMSSVLVLPLYAPGPRSWERGFSFPLCLMGSYL